MVVDYPSMSSVNVAISDLCSLIPNVPSASRQFSGRATLRAATCSFKMISFANLNKQYGKQLLFS